MPKISQSPFILLAALSFMAALPTHAASGPPVAPIRPVTDTYFGQKVVDPYRWMEKDNNPELAAWFKGQNAYTRSVLDKIPGRAAMLARIKALDHAGYTVGDLEIAGNRYFYMKTTPASDNHKLYIREGLHGAERILVDPEKLTKNGVHSSIDYYTASIDGKYVAYGLSPGGSEDSVLHVLETATGKPLSEQIDRTQYGGISWRPDGRSFFYNRLQKLPKGASELEKFKNSRVWLHVLGTDPNKDKAIFGMGMSLRVAMTPVDSPYVSVTPASKWAYGIVQRGVQNEMEIYAAPATTLTSGAIPWRKMAGFADDVTGFDVHGDTVYLLTHKSASRFAVTRIDLGSKGWTRQRVVVPQGNVVITAISAAKDALYIKDLDGGITHLRRMDFAGGPAARIALPYEGSVAALVTTWDKPGCVFLETGWTRSALWYAYDPRTGRVADTKLKPKSPVDFSSITSVEVKAQSADGTMVPLSIIYPKGLKLDGSHPTVLDGYGAYGITIDPGFDPESLPWYERGGVVAIAHCRGGGEYGEDWHKAGMKLTKQHTIDDFIACAKYLISHKYTSRAHLAGTGTSAGGITVGRAITERPDLFRAAMIRVGSSNPLRSELSPNGPPNIPEFGSFTTPDGFKALYEMDPYLHVLDKTWYPAVMVTTGIHDPRVSSWEPAKMAARLQAANSGPRPILLRVDYDAGHGMGSTKSQEEQELTDQTVFLFWQLGVEEFQPKG